MGADAPEDNRKRYDEALALLDDTRAKVVALLRAVNQAETERRPSEAAWSIGEIADHLALTERAYVAGVAQLAAHAQPHEFAYAEVAAGRKFSVADLGDPAVTGKFITPPDLVPARGKPLPELLRALEEARAESRRRLAPHRDEDLGVKFFRHPKMGPITLYERLANIAYHELKHLHQMQRTLARLAEKGP